MGQLRVQSRLYAAAANLTNIAYAVSPSIGIAYNAGSQRTAVTNTAGNYLNYAYDLTSQLKTALGYESNGTVRFHAQFGYAYDAAKNVQYRTNNALVRWWLIIR